jgi:hypothetical protein
MQQFQKGSDGYADQQGIKYLPIIGAVVYLLILLILFNVFPNYVGYAFKRASVLANIAGVILVIASYLLLLGASHSTTDSKSGWVYGFGIIFFLGLGICLACGFNFDLHGIPNVE